MGYGGYRRVLFDFFRLIGLRGMPDGMFSP